MCRSCSADGIFSCSNMDYERTMDKDNGLGTPVVNFNVNKAKDMGEHVSIIFSSSLTGHGTTVMNSEGTMDNGHELRANVMSYNDKESEEMGERSPGVSNRVSMLLNGHVTTLENSYRTLKKDDGFRITVINDNEEDYMGECSPGLSRTGASSLNHHRTTVESSNNYSCSTSKKVVAANDRHDDTSLDLLDE